MADAIAELKKSAILEGEIVARDERGHPRFEWLLNRGPQKLSLRLRFAEAWRCGLAQRAASPEEKPFEKLLKGNPRLLYVDHMEREGLAMFAGALALGLEGVVAKDAKSPYVDDPRAT